jgi:hypothetical protein
VCARCGREGVAIVTAWLPDGAGGSCAMIPSVKAPAVVDAVRDRGADGCAGTAAMGTIPGAAAC